MKYITVYTTHDRTHIPILKGLFEKDKITYNILGAEEQVLSSNEQKEIRFQVDERFRDKARELLHETGFIKSRYLDKIQHRKPFKRWMFVFLAALIVVLVAVIITWIMRG